MAFGNVEAVSKAGLDELAGIKGISGEQARTIADFFLKKGERVEKDNNNISS